MARVARAVQLDRVPVPLWIDDSERILFANAETRRLFSLRAGRSVPLERCLRFEPPRSQLKRRLRPYEGELVLLRSSRAGQRCAVRSQILSTQPLRWINAALGLERTWELESHLARESEARVHAEARVASQEAWVGLGRLVAGVAHNLRNPLFGITSTLDALEARLGETAPAEFFEVLRREASRLNRIVGQLLAYSRAGSLRRRQLHSPRSLIEAAMQHCEATARERVVRIKVDASTDLSPLLVDAEQVVQALTNLVENAIAFAPEGSTVSVSARSEPKEGTAGVTLQVRDHGPGFEPEVLAQAFEPFVSRRPGGTGLGLALAARVVREHGGHIQVSNHPHGGAVITMWLPIEENKTNHEGRSIDRRR